MEDSPIPAEPHRVPRAQSSLRRRIALLGTGALAAVGGSLLRSPRVEDGSERSPPARPVALWIADRDGNAVYGLDEGMILARRASVNRPTAVAARPDAGAWVLRSADLTSGGPSSLVRIDAQGAILSEMHLLACAGLACLDDGSAIVLEKAGEGEGLDRVVRCGEDGGREIVHSGRALTCIAAAGRSIGIGDADGRVLRVSLDPPGAVIAAVDLHERVVEIEAAPGADPWWVLTVSEGAKIRRLDAGLDVLWTADAGSPATSLAADRDSTSVWLVDGSRSTVRRLGEQGGVESERGELPVLGVCRAVRSLGGGLSIASPGCILRLDPMCRTLPGQGGFAHLVDVDRVP